MSNMLLTLIKETKDTANGLFPGIDASAFEEHHKSKQGLGTSEVIARKIKQFEDLENTIINQRYAVRRKFISGSAWNNNSPDNIPVGELPWIDKYPLSRQDLNSYTVDKNSPLFDRMERIISGYEANMEREDRYKRTIKRLKSKLTRVKKKESEQSLKDKSASTPQQQIDPTKLPRTIDIQYRTQNASRVRLDTIDNPYFLVRSTSSAMQFAGHPVHFPWAGKERTMFYDVSQWAKKLGYPEFDTMYASKPSSYTYGSFLRYYLKNTDGSMIITNDSSRRIFVYVKSPNYPNDPPMRWRMRHLRGKDIAWLHDKLIP